MTDKVPARPYGPMWNSPWALADTILRNLAVFYEAVFYMPGLDPEQRGTLKEFQWTPGAWTGFLIGSCFVCFAPILGFGTWAHWVLFILSPAFACMFFEFVPPEPGRPRLYQGPRVWLPRWSVLCLAIAMFWAPWPDFVRYALLVLWIGQSFHYSRFYASDRVFYEQVRRENPNRDRFRAASLGWVYLRDGDEVLSEMEIMAVHKADPLNARAALLVALMQQNIRMIHEHGQFPMTFVCNYCREPNGQPFREGVLLKEKARITAEEHAMYFQRVCPRCQRVSQTVNLN